MSTPAGENLIAHLNELRFAAGNPTQARLAQVGAGQLSERAMDQELVVAQNVDLPSWESVAAYVSACHYVASLQNWDPIQLGTLPAWRSYYRELARGDNLHCPIGAMCRHCPEPETSRTGEMRFQSDAQDSDSEFTDYGTLTQAEYDLLSQEIDKLERSAAAQGTALLLAVNYAMSGTIYWLDRSEIRVGRVAGNDIIIPNVQASRTHAIIATRDRVSIRDAKSLNGTFVNGDRIDQEIDLQHEDIIGIAGVKLVLLVKKHKRRTWLR